MRKRFLLLSLAAVVGVLALSSSAFAATMSESGTTVTWTGDEANFTGIDFDEYTDEELYIWTSEDPVVYDDDGNTSAEITADCVDDDGDTESPADQVLCTDVDVLRANGGAGDDFFDAAGCAYNCSGPGLGTILADFEGGLGEDDLHGGYAEPGAGGGDTLDGGQGADDLFGNDGEDELTGGDNADYLQGDDDDDVLQGDEGEDELRANDGDDTLRGAGGDDELYPNDGDDDAEGGDGNDYIEQFDDGGVDVARGEGGVDELYYGADDNGSSSNDDVTLNVGDAGAAQVGTDGDTEEDPDNEFEGFENLRYDTDDEASATATTGAGTDSIDGDDGLDEMTPGDGPDFLDMEDNEDVANTVDGYPDFVDCGEDEDGNDVDTANADQFDTLVNCEDENITEVESAFEDPNGTPPTVRLTAPGNGAVLPAFPGTTMMATASDDVGVVQVIFIDDNTVLCTDTAAPYECEYEPTTDDVGRNTLSVWAVDANGQFGADFAEVTVNRFDSTLKTRVNKRDTNGVRKVKVRGTLELEEGVSAEDGCEGVVRLTVSDGNDRLKRRRAQIQEDCTYAKTIKLPPVGTIDRKKVKTKSKFLGNDVVQKDKAPTKKTKVQ